MGQFAESSSGRKSFETTSDDFTPLSRTIPRCAGPGGEASATIVSSRSSGMVAM